MTLATKTEETPRIELTVRVSPDFVPEDGDVFDNVMDALDFFDITAMVTTVTTQPQIEENPWPEFSVRVRPDFVPKEGDAFDAVIAALDFFDITSIVTLKTGQPLTEQDLPKG